MEQLGGLSQNMLTNLVLSMRDGRADSEITPALGRAIKQLSELYAKRNRKTFGRFSEDLLAFSAG